VRAPRQTDHYEPACFTVSNLGMLGVEAFTAIINPPETGILAVGGVQKRPVVQNATEDSYPRHADDDLVVDHRAVTGPWPPRSFSRIKHHLENPETLTA